MKLLALDLQNFKGIKNFTLAADGKDVEVYGRNGTGKTTLCDALSFLLFDKDSKGNAKFEIKTLKKDGSAKTGLEHITEGSFEFDDGKVVTLKKIYFEKWTKKRGDPLPTCTGNTTKYFIDTVPCKKKEYAETIAKIADEETFRLLTNPSYFAEQMHWKDRSKLVLEVCGDVSDEDVIKSNKKLVELPAILGDKSCDDMRKIVHLKRSEINEGLKKIPVKITEVEHGMPELPTNLDELKVESETLQNDKKTADNVYNLIKEGGQGAELKKNLALAEQDVLLSQNKGLENRNKESGTIIAEMDAVKLFISDSLTSMRETESLIEAHRATILVCGETKVKLLARYKEINGSKFDESSNLCPTCSQDLPPEMVDIAREKFNVARADNLSENIASGKEVAKSIENLEADVDRLDVVLNRLSGEITTKQAELAELKQKFEALGKTPEVEKTGAEKNRDLLLDQIELLESNEADELGKAKDICDGLQVKIDAVEVKLGAVGERTKGDARIEELNSEQKDLARNFEELEKHLFLIDLFTKTKVSLLEGKINKKFKLARFKMFTEQINGGLDDTCQVTYNGIPFDKSLNTGHKILVGLDIINTLTDHYGVCPPVFIDNAESITEPIVAKAQCIKLVASKEDDVLRVEV